jgi:ferredoxin--NADP+ reductase
MREVSDELIVMTDDGSRGRKGLVTEPLKELLDRGGAAAGGQAVPPAPGRALFGGVAKVWAIGPAIMMKFVALASRPYAVPTIVSLNTVMVDGTGMCGGCRVSLEGGAKFVCVDGPEFDGHLVDWDLLLSRMTFYRGQEAESIERWGKDHACRLDAAGENV